MDPEGLRLVPLTAWMQASGIPVDDSAPLRASLLAGGRSNVSYRLRDASGGDWVLRRPPLGHVLPSAHDMVREFRVLSGLNSVGFPTPPVVALCQDDGVIGASFLLMGFVDGRVIDSQDRAAAIDPVEAGAICASLVDTLADLHAIDAEAAGLGELGRPDGYLERQVRRWSQQWQLTKTREVSDVDALQSALETVIPSVPAGRAAIVHGDYRLDNTILGLQEPTVQAVVDWEMATLGDPVMDLAVTLVYWTDPGDALRASVPVAEHITDRPGFWTRERVVERYAERTGSRLDGLDACTALACFKLAVIMESILARSLQGQQLGAGAAEIDGMRSATEALAAMGRQVLAHGAIAGLAS